MKKGLIISQKTLLTFIKQRRLSGTVDFLNFIKKQSGLKDFYNFCNKSNYKLQEYIPGNVLLHGSFKKQSLLIPNASIGPDGVAEHKVLVYATDDPNYAIFLALLHLNEFGWASVHASRQNTKLSVNLGFINGSSKLKNGYVYIISNKFFKRMKNREYQTSKAVDILFGISVTPQDLTVSICIQIKPPFN